SRKSPRADALPAIFAIFPSRASRYEFTRIRRRARPRSPPPPKKKAIPAPTAANRAPHETRFGFTWIRREATGTRNQSAALRYRSKTIPPNRGIVLQPRRVKPLDGVGAPQTGPGPAYSSPHRTTNGSHFSARFADY